MKIRKKPVSFTVHLKRGGVVTNGDASMRNELDWIVFRKASGESFSIANDVSSEERIAAHWANWRGDKSWEDEYLIPIEEGSTAVLWINQKNREIEVLSIKKTRARYEYEMPGRAYAGTEDRVIGAWGRISKLGGEAYLHTFIRGNGVDYLAPSYC